MHGETITFVRLVCFTVLACGQKKTLRDSYLWGKSTINIGATY